VKKPWGHQDNKSDAEVFFFISPTAYEPPGFRIDLRQVDLG
jgi:hypothetical protein